MSPAASRDDLKTATRKIAHLCNAGIAVPSVPAIYRVR